MDVVFKASSVTTFSPGRRLQSTIREYQVEAPTIPARTFKRPLRWLSIQSETEYHQTLIHEL